MAVDGVAAIESTMQAVSVVGREGEGIAQVAFVAIEAAIVVVGMEIGHVGTHDESSQPHVDGLSEHPALATLVFMTQSSIELCASGKAAEVVACRKAQPVLLVVNECR